ncbi:insulinase family protein [bacterium]|nr:MAG: insulinase family protein [bacterium]
MKAWLLAVALAAAGLLPAPPADAAAALAVAAPRIIDLTSESAPVTAMQVFVPAGLDRQPRNRSGLAAVVAQALLETPVHGTPLELAAALSGGSITYTVEGQETHFYLEAAPSNFAAVAVLFASALTHPDFGAPALERAAAYVTQRALAASRDGLGVGAQMVRSVYLAKTSAALPAWGSAPAIAQITPVDAADFFRENYVAGGAIIVGAGAAAPGLQEAERTVAAALPDRHAGWVVVSSQLPVKASSREIVTHRDIAATWIVLGYDAPAPGAPDFAPVFVLESLIGHAVGRGLAPPLVPTPTAAEMPVGSLYFYDTVPSAVIVYANGAGGDPALAVRTVASVVDTLAAGPLTQVELGLAKAQARGNLLFESATLADRSWLAGNFAREGAGADYEERLLAAISRVTPAQLQAAAKRYFTRYTTAVVLPRGARP